MPVGVVDRSKNVPEIGEDDTAIVVDALRASATVVTLLEVGAKEVTPVTEVPPEGVDDGVLVGEEEGKTLRRAALGNSPKEILNNASQVSGRSVVLRTTNGTGCVRQVGQAGSIYMGSLVNLTSLADTVDESVGEGDVWVVAAGRRGDTAPEDIYTARRIASELLDRGDVALNGEVSESRDATEVFRGSNTGRFLRSIGQREDIDFCAQTDRFGVVPVMEQGSFVDAT
jgi:2-phosphosulfolactate phosphatase